MSDWQPGDLALCITVRHPKFKKTSTQLRKGAIYHVTIAAVGRCEGYEEMALAFSEIEVRGFGFPASMFRKVTPPAEMKIVEREAPVDIPEPVSGLSQKAGAGWVSRLAAPHNSHAPAITPAEATAPGVVNPSYPVPGAVFTEQHDNPTIRSEAKDNV